MENRIKKELNPIQQKAVRNINRASLIIAGAGSGKTRVLTYRIAYMLAKGIPAESILSLTFTNKAANEMKERINSMLGKKVSSQIWMGTFHSIFARILRKEAVHLGYTSNFIIYDQTDSKNLIKHLVAELNLDPKQYVPKAIQSRISKAKNNLMTFQAYKNNQELIQQDKKHNQGQFIEIYEKYTIRCHKNNAMDFDDLLVNINVLFRKHPSILEKYQNIFKYILVDEYQDTNYAQYLILKFLASKHHNISVVGDDAQSIYAFRGARIENILNFKNDYPDYKLFKLEQNYRSTQTIVNAANSLISQNKTKIDKKIFSKNDEGDKIKVFQTSTDGDEAMYIAGDIFETRENTKCEYSEFAILYRTNAQSRQLEESLRKKDIPYRIYGGLSFYQRKEIKDLIAYFRLSVNPQDNEALKRIINYPSRKIGGKTIENLDKYALEKGISTWDVINKLGEHNPGLNSGTTKRIDDFALLIRSFQNTAETSDVITLANNILKTSGILYTLKNDRTPEGISRLENVQELINGIQDYVDEKKLEDENAFILMSDYLENVALLSNLDTVKDGEESKVNLMTIHSAKGLEFDNVYIAGVEENLFPGKMSTFSRADIEEERRLFYVAMTRARIKLVITHSSSRYRFGSIQFNEKSRFISDINSEYLDIEGNESGNSDVDPFEGMFDNSNELNPPRPNKYKQRNEKILREKPKNTILPNRLVPIQESRSDLVSNSNPEIDNQEIRAGQNIRHARFGKGKVIELEGEGSNRKAIVIFDKFGEKKLLLKFARLKVLDN